MNVDPTKSEERIRAEYKQRRNRQIIYFFCMISSFAITFVAALWNVFIANKTNELPSVEKIWLICLILLGLVCAVLSFVSWWCPACFKKFPASLNMNFCPFCGTKLNEYVKRIAR